jgi:SWI/SNF-related matrix-associated actin-dependent regulator 1 of chromatin subfamily A
MKYIPRQYQIEGKNFLQARRFAMLGDACGVGKTGQALIALDPSWRVLVVCPASVKVQWQTAFMDWIGVSAEIIGTTKDKLKPTPVQIINYDLMYRERLLAQLLRTQWDLIIFDEAHKLKSPTSKRTKAALTMKGLRGRTKRIWFLTGTPVKNRPVDLYPILKSCAPEVLKPYDSYLKFVYRYCGAYQGSFGLDVSGASHMEELGDRLRSFMLRREKRDVLTELPPRIISKVELECTPAVKKIIEDEEQATIEQAGENDPTLFKLGEQVRIRKALAKYKVGPAVEYIKDLLEEDKIVVFYHHKEVLRDLQKSFEKTGSVFIDGGVSPDKRKGVVDRFVSNRDTNLFFGQMEACGEGIDGLQDASATAVFIEPSWSHTDLEQCIGRLERSGQRNDINVHILVIKDTLESKMMDVVAMKLNTDKRLYNQQTKEKTMAKVKKTEITPTEKELRFLAALRDLMGEPTDPAPEVEQEPAEKAPQEVESAEEEPQEVEPVKDEDVTEEAIRARCSDICSLSKDNKGKELCINIIKKVGGGKIADLKTPAQRVQCMEALDAAYKQMAR